jgi:hypothetical protein
MSRKGAKPQRIYPLIQRNPPRRTSLRAFSAYIGVEKLGFVRSTTADTSTTAEYPAAGVGDDIFSFPSKSAAVDMALHS